MNGTMTRRESEIRAWLVSRIADATGLPPDDLSEDEPLASLGLGSSEFVILSGELEDWLGQPVPPTVVWEFPTIGQLARALARGETR